MHYGGDTFPNLFVSAKGATATDDTGHEILDFASVQMCATVGHNHPAIVAAMEESGRKAAHPFSGMIPDVVAKLGKALDDYLPALQQEAAARGLLLIFDEAQTAFGRIGHRFGATRYKVTPDIMAVSKTLGGGLPLAATITSEAI